MTIPWLDFSSPQERHKRQQEYFRWSFPYGEPQRQAVAALLAQLLPGEDAGLAMAAYLNGRDAYRDREETGLADDRRLEACGKALRKALPAGRRSECFLYAALVEADARAKSPADYPSTDELRRRAAALERGG